jgi:PAS domain S-box-containing protein
MPVKLKIGQKGLLFILIPGLIGLIIFGALAILLQQAEQDLERERLAKILVAESAGLVRSLDEMNRSLKGLSKSHAPVFRDEVEKNRNAFKSSLKRIESGLYSQEQKNAFVELKSASDVAIQEVTETEKELATAPDEVVHSLMDEMERKFEALRSTLNSKQEIFSGATLAVQQSSQLQGQQYRDAMRNILLAGLALTIGGALWMFAFFSKTITKRLLIMSDNSFRLASQMPLNEQDSGFDEIAEVDKTFHWMARRIDESARRERAMTENAVDVICSITEEGNFREVNAAALNVWGYSPEELLGQRYISLVRESDREKTSAALQEARVNKLPLAYENAIRHKNNHYVEVLWSGTWSEKDNAMFCVAHDITEKKRIENLKRDFVNMVSHDLRTPLTSVQAFLEMVAQGIYDNNPEKVRTKAKHSEADIGRLISMINSLLQLEKMEAGHIEIVQANTQVEDVVERAINSVQSLAERTNISLQTKVCDAVIYADEDQLIQVLVNLLSNAIKFSNANSSVIVEAVELDETVEFRVIDSGRGIGADFIDKVFDRFKQVELSDSRVKGGTGLGLAVCKMLVEAHGGNIWVTSVEGKGSTFHFVIPKSMPSKV